MHRLSSSFCGFWWDKATIWRKRYKKCGRNVPSVNREVHATIGPGGQRYRFPGEFRGLLIFGSSTNMNKTAGSDSPVSLNPPPRACPPAAPWGRLPSRLRSFSQSIRLILLSGRLTQTPLRDMNRANLSGAGRGCLRPDGFGLAIRQAASCDRRQVWSDASSQDLSWPPCSPRSPAARRGNGEAKAT